MGRTKRDRYDGRREAKEGHQRLTAKAAFFYSDNRMVASIDPLCIQLAFDMLMGLFGRVGLRKNV